MRLCHICKEHKSESEFNRNSSRADGLQVRCKPCDSEMSQAYYRTHRERQLANIAGNKKRRFLDRREKLTAYLDEHPCVDCGESRIECLEFDHLGDKVANISTAIRNWSWTRLLTEIEKCEVRCANCHRVRTAQQQGWYGVLVNR